MPRIVDHDKRRQEIAQLALVLLARDGASGLTLRALARELGGSLTLVTHYYPSRSLLMRDLATQLTQAWLAELAELEAQEPDPVRRLYTLLYWMLPLTSEGREEEWARFALLIDRNDEDARSVLIEFDDVMRALLHRHLRDVLPASNVSSAVQLLRAVTNGIVLDCMIAPEHWTASRQRGVVQRAVALLLDARGAVAD